MQAGILHAAEQKDWKTAYRLNKYNYAQLVTITLSYFYEAFEGYDSVDSKKRAVVNLR